MGANDKRGCVIEMEYRRKSGRGVGEWFFVPELAEQNNGDGIGEGEGVKGGGEGGSGNGSEGIVLLDDQVLYKGFDGNGDEGGGQGMGVEVEVERGTFELGLSDKQRRDREGVVLPFLDAQKGEGAGGRILYEMGKEDDFDEEEDEI